MVKLQNPKYFRVSARLSFPNRRGGVPTPPPYSLYRSCDRAFLEYARPALLTSNIGIRDKMEVDRNICVRLAEGASAFTRVGHIRSLFDLPIIMGKCRCLSSNSADRRSRAKANGPEKRPTHRPVLRDRGNSKRPWMSLALEGEYHDGVRPDPLTLRFYTYMNSVSHAQLSISVSIQATGESEGSPVTVYTDGSFCHENGLLADVWLSLEAGRTIRVALPAWIFG